MPLYALKWLLFCEASHIRKYQQEKLPDWPSHLPSPKDFVHVSLVLLGRLPCTYLVSYDANLWQIGKLSQVRALRRLVDIPIQ
mgnify:CR=1 FL=1